MSDRGFRPRIRSILILVNLAILALPLIGIASLRLYENELIRGTEAQLLLQGAVVREMFLLGFRDASGRSPGNDAPTTPSDPTHDALLPSLDITREAPLPQAPQATASTVPTDPEAVAAGGRIMPSLQAAVRATLVGVRVTDAAGNVVASSGSELGLSISAREEVSRALRGETVSLLRVRTSEGPAPAMASVSRGQRYRVFVALPVRDGTRIVGAVVLSRTPLDISKALWLNRRPILLGAAAVIAVVVLVSVLTSLTISRPLRALLEKATRVARGERVDLAVAGGTATREVSQLWEAVEAMARTLEDRADYIRTFASHVSHEFKTPLTTLRGSLELLRDHIDTMSPEERARFLTNAEESASRLDRLVRRLLDLARADVARPGDGEADLRRVIDRLAERYSRASFHVDASVENDVGTVAISDEMLDEILTNLVDNARQHGGHGVAVRIAARRTMVPAGAAVELTVEDDGRGVSDANLQRIFTPFFTTARERGGSGLGLSIVESLVAAHGGSIAYVPGRRGAAFRLIIPATQVHH